MKILLFGKNGQIGRELQHSLSPLGELICFDRTQVDIADFNALSDCLKQHAPDWIVNTAAYTQVDRAESESKIVQQINANAVSLMAEYADKSHGWLVHYSSDYVFDGKKRSAYVEEDAAHPLNIYGQSKLLSEQLIVASGCKHLIFRSGWIYSNHGHNFVKSILRLLNKNQPFSVVGDQWGSPSSAELVANVSTHCMQQLIKEDSTSSAKKSGLYHLATIGETSWYELAGYIAAKMQHQQYFTEFDLNNILPVTSAQYSSSATRPKYSKLNADKLQQTFDTQLPEWQVPLDKVLQQFIHTGSLPV